MEVQETLFRIIRLYGIVQGVGFRPFVSRAAERCGIRGSVANKGSYVEVIACGSEPDLKEFYRILKNEAPERSIVLKMEILPGEAFESGSFEIVESRHEAGDIFVSPDIGICPACAGELFDPADRRYQHPFINCTACGPRLTILDAMPYDRERTSMKEFPMCPECASEYYSPDSRRYDAQPVCCNECGPELYLLGRPERGREALETARNFIADGKVVAIKGIGGFHLCCDARNPEAVSRLRELKHRPAKPFALMMRDLDTVKKECVITPELSEILNGFQKPVLLLPKREDCTLPDIIAPGNPALGVMLPYAPVQMLLFDHPGGVELSDTLVMTSGNLSGAPICRNDAEVEEQILRFCDLVLSHDRRIRLRADDSVLDTFRGEPYMIRRSRGYAPLPFSLSMPLKGEVIGVGGELKNTFCPAKDGLFYPSAYIGDLADLRSVKALRESISRMNSLLEIKPAAAGCDLHPRYNSTILAGELGVPLVQVQHHYAHILSCMVENDFCDPVIGISFDGTGYGSDGTIWGGEFLLSSYRGFERMGSVEPFVQAGGDASARAGWRIAAALVPGRDEGEKLRTLAALGLGDREKELRFQLRMMAGSINAVTSTSCGRIFDGISALLGVCHESTFEGEGAIKLQFAALKSVRKLIPEMKLKNGNDHFHLDTAGLAADIVQLRLAGETPEDLAWYFHRGLADGVIAGAVRCRELTGVENCALSGGVFQNTLLLDMCVSGLEKAGFKVLRHHLLPPNDGGIAVGQAAAALYKLNQEKK